MKMILALIIVFVVLSNNTIAAPPSTKAIAADEGKVHDGNGQSKDDPADEEHAAVEPFDGWGETVNGLRLQLFVVRKEYVVGEAIDLTLLLQNVSDKEVILPQISLMPTVANGESHPYGEMHPYNTMISFRIPNGKLCILWALQESIITVRESIRLGAGELHVATIRLPENEQLEKLMDAKRRVGDKDYGGGLTRHTATFPLAHDPGRYVVPARYHPSSLAKNPPLRLQEQTDPNWQGELLESNPVELLIVAPKRDEVETRK